MISLSRLFEQRKEYFWVIIIFAGLVCLNFVREVNRYDLVMIGDQIGINWLIVKDLHPELRASDTSPIFGGDRYKWYIPAYRIVLKGVALWFNEDFNVALKFLGAIETFVFLVSMFILTKLIIKNTIASFLASLVATSIRWCVGATYWGASGILSSQPRTAFLMFTPLFLWLLIRWRDSSEVYLVFFLVGVVANIHPVSGYLFAQILWLTLLSIKGFNRQGLQSFIWACVAVIVGVSPYLLSFVNSGVNTTLSGVAYHIWGVQSLHDVLEGFLITGWYLWFPFLLFIIAWMLLKKLGRLEEKHKILIHFALITILVSVFGELANNIFFALTKIDITLLYFRSFKLIYLPIFVFVGVLFYYILNIDKRHFLKIFLIVFLFFGLTFSTSRTYLRWLFPLSAQDFVKIVLFRNDKITVMNSRLVAERQAADFDKVSLWARENLPLGDLVLVLSSERRFLVTGRRMVRYAPERCEELLTEECFLSVIKQDERIRFILANNKLNLTFEPIYSNDSYVIYKVEE